MICCANAVVETVYCMFGLLRWCTVQSGVAAVCLSLTLVGNEHPPELPVARPVSFSAALRHRQIPHHLWRASASSPLLLSPVSRSLRTSSKRNKCLAKMLKESASLVVAVHCLSPPVSQSPVHLTRGHILQ